MAKSVRAKLAEQVAAATRMLVEENVLDYSGHISCRLPGTDTFLIQPVSDSRAELDPDRLVIVDLDGNVVEGNWRPPLEVALHVEILKARPDVQAVLHCHMDEAITFTLMKDVPILPLRVYAKRWAAGIPTHADPGHVNTPEKGAALAETLGEGGAALIRAHGLVMVAESVPALFVDAVHFRENCDQQLRVMQVGREPVPLTEDEMELIAGPRDFHVAKLWNYYVRKNQAGGIVPQDWDSDF